ncbi:hypothetical protein BU15DRAFT_66234 [Melanogaster broomeanus]|nr:hypothetical protein BU15DRAFT_66234 [Melanogaster broomeanus]
MEANSAPINHPHNKFSKPSKPHRISASEKLAIEETTIKTKPPPPPQRSGPRYKEKFQTLRERFDQVSALHEQYERDLQTANARMRKIQAENDITVPATPSLMHLIRPSPTGTSSSIPITSSYAHPPPQPQPASNHHRNGHEYDHAHGLPDANGRYRDREREHGHDPLEQLYWSYMPLYDHPPPSIIPILLTVSVAGSRDITWHRMTDEHVRLTRVSNLEDWSRSRVGHPCLAKGRGWFTVVEICTTVTVTVNARSFGQTANSDHSQIRSGSPDKLLQRPTFFMSDGGRHAGFFSQQLVERPCVHENQPRGRARADSDPPEEDEALHNVATWSFTDRTRGPASGLPELEVAVLLRSN